MNAKILLLALPLVLFSCSNNNNKSDAYGNFEAKEVIVSAEAQGEIITFDMEEGDLLSQGQHIGLIDTTQLSIQREQLFAQKQAVGSKLISVDAQINVQTEQVSVLTIEKNRIKKLYKDNAATKQQVDDINGKLSVLQKQIEATKSQRSSIEKEVVVVSKKIKQVEDQINRALIVNPINGTVLEKYLEANEIAFPGKALYKMARLDQVDLRVYISGAQLSAVKLGQQVKVFIDNDAKTNKEYSGKIIWISNQAEFTPKIIQTKEERVNMVYAVKIRVENDGGIKIGMPGEVKF